MKAYKLLTPGPLTTTETVKKEMMFDHCTWDDDYKEITQKIRRDLLELAHVSEEEYTVVLMQGSGTFGVESVITSSVGAEEKILVCSNGAYGERMAQIARQAGKNLVVYQENYDRIPDAEKIRQMLKEDPAITHVGMIHCETTSGILNDIEAVGKVVKEEDRTFIVDGMSSFGGVEIDVKGIGIDFIISSANKCVQGVPGFSYIICKRSELLKCKGKCLSHSLDLYDQWETMEMGIRTYIDGAHQGPIITTFFVPEIENYSFEKMYHYIKERGYAIYPGKVTDADTFRLGNIGEIYLEDVDKVCDIFEEFFKTQC